MKKIISSMLALVMLATTLMALPFSAQAAGRFPNIDLSITSYRPDNGLPVGRPAKAPDAVFDVTCNDSNGVNWIVGSGTSTYWATSSGTKLTSSDAISKYSSYKLQLCVYPDVVNESENEVDINEVKQITFNGVPLTASQYTSGELGNSIYITVNFYYVEFTNVANAKSGFYVMNQQVPVTANNVADKHFVNWSGTYYTGSGSRSVTFEKSTAKSTTFTVPYSSAPITIAPNYEEHTFDTYVTKATTSKNGKTTIKCSVCGAVQDEAPIYYPKSIKLSTSTYTYDGKVKKPSVKVVDANGDTINSSNYTVTYASGRKNVGKYSVKVTFKGNYSGTKTLYFTIKPKATSISSLSAGSKKFTVKWKKQSTQVTGYQIQYSTSSKFTSPKTVTVSSYKTTSKTISKLKGKKKYYVRVRTYKTVSGTKYYSNWSSAKSVTTKK
ncbi:MAG: fibronectin type III domain-containing protein [Eubacterium sp.]